jgi:hypothetical protein
VQIDAQTFAARFSGKREVGDLDMIFLPIRIWTGGRRWMQLAGGPISACRRTHFS